MFTNYIKQANTLNQIKIDKSKGVAVYGNHAYFWASSVLLLIAFIGIILVVVNETEVEKIFILVLLLPYIAYQIQKMVGLALITNPIFLFVTDQIYYLKTDLWYSIHDHTLKDVQVGRHNYFKTFCIRDHKGNNIVAEQNIYCSQIDSMKNEIKKVLLKAYQKQNSRND